MEVADERANAGEVMCVEGDRAFLPLWEGGVARLGAQRELPEFGSGGLALSSQEDGPVVGENRDRRFFKRGVIPSRLW